MVCEQKWDRISQLRLLFLPAMYDVGFRRRQLLHAEWNPSKLSAQARSSTLKPDAGLALTAMVDPCDRVRGLLRSSLLARDGPDGRVRDARRANPRHLTTSTGQGARCTMRSARLPIMRS